MKITGVDDPKSGLMSKFSINHSASVAYVDRAAGILQYTDARAGAPDILDFRAKIVVATVDGFRKDQAAATLIARDGELEYKPFAVEILKRHEVRVPAADAQAREAREHERPWQLATSVQQVLERRNLFTSQPPAASRHTAQVGVSPTTPRAQTLPHSNETPRARTLTAQAPAENAGRQQAARLGRADL